MRPIAAGRSSLSFGEDGITALPAPTSQRAALETSALPASPVRRPLSRYVPRPSGVELSDPTAVTYSCGSKEAQMRMAVDPALLREAALSPGAGARVLVVDRTGSKPMNVGGLDSFLRAAATHPDEGPQRYSESVQESQRRSVFDFAAQEAAAAQPVAGANVRVGDRGLRVTRPSGGPHNVALAWPEAQGSPEPRSRLARLRSVDAASDAVAGIAVGGTPNTAGGKQRDSAAALLGGGCASDTSGAPGTPSGGRMRLLYPDQPVGGRSAPFMPGGGSGGGGGTPSAGTGYPGFAPHDLTPQRMHASGQGSSGSFAPYASSEPASDRVSGAFPRVNRTPQPVGGRGLLSAGLSGLDAADPRVGGGAPRAATPSTGVRHAMTSSSLVLG